MFTLLLFVLATIGLTNVLVHSKLLDDDHTGLRSWAVARLGRYGDVLECYECTGFWAGLLVGVFTLLAEYLFTPAFLFHFAFAGAALGNIYTILSTYIDSKTDFVLSEDHDEQDQPAQ